MPTTTAAGYEISDDAGRVDRDVVCANLSSQAYWARWRSRAEVEQQIDGAWWVVAAYVEDTGELFRWLLHTADAHEMYAAHGFGPGDATFMERPFRRRTVTHQ